METFELDKPLNPILSGDVMPFTAFYEGNLPESGEIIAGSIGNLDNDGQNYRFDATLKYGQAYEAATAVTEIKIKKGHNFGTGDGFFDGTNVRTIDGIDSTNEDYDILTLSDVITVVLNSWYRNTSAFPDYDDSTQLSVVSETVKWEGENPQVSVICAGVLDWYKMPYYAGAENGGITARYIHTVPMFT